VLTALPCEGCIPVSQVMDDQHPSDTLLRLAVPGASGVLLHS
jgi:hypothetical protein